MVPFMDLVLTWGLDIWTSHRLHPVRFGRVQVSTWELTGTADGWQLCVEVRLHRADDEPSSGDESVETWAAAGPCGNLEGWFLRLLLAWSALVPQMLLDGSRPSHPGICSKKGFLTNYVTVENLKIDGLGWICLDVFPHLGCFLFLMEKNMFIFRGVATGSIWSYSSGFHSAHLGKVRVESFRGAHPWQP